MPDPAANPYLALGAVFAAGLDGVKRALKTRDWPPPYVPAKPTTITIGGTPFTIIGIIFESRLPDLQAAPYDPEKSKALLAEAGYPQGFDAGEYSCDAVYAGVIEGVVNDLGAVGIRAKVQPRERAAIEAQLRDRPMEEALANATAALSGLSACAGVVVAPKLEQRLKHPNQRSTVQAELDKPALQHIVEEAATAAIRTCWRRSARTETSWNTCRSAWC